MQIFQTEINDGLGKALSSRGVTRVRASAKTVNVNAVQNQTFAEVLDEIKHGDSIAELVGYPASDLALIDSILVSTGLNRNDDLFTPEDLWSARSTPAHKPINIGHDDKQIIGHMIRSKAVDKNGNEIVVNDESPLPNEFDLEAVGVLYKNLPGIAKDIAQIIEEADKGEAFVSMEVWFDSFDYVLIDEATGACMEIIPRTQKTAFLTKHLKAYGGTGKYNNARIGRVLRGLEFGGEGITKHPANPDSVIKEISIDTEISEATLKTTKGGVDMADNNEGVQNQSIEELQAKLDETTASLNDWLSKGLEKQVETLNATIASKDEEIQKLCAAQADAETKLSDAMSRLAEAEAELASIRKTEKARARLADLAKVKQIADEQATMAELADMTDETFALVLKYASASEVKKSEDKVKEQDVSTAEVLDAVTEETPEVDLHVSLEDEMDQLSKAAKATASCLLGRKLKA